MPVLIPDLLYRAGAFHADLALEYDLDTGRIVRIVPAWEVDRRGAERLERCALIPGFINAHSHAFQRLIRGRTQWRPHGVEHADFWSWREAMYAAALELTPDDVYDVALACFVEMLRAGITCVGEFHYLHNDRNGAPYDDRTLLARRVIDAAADAGIRICLLNVCYATGGIGEPLNERQRRFATPDLDGFLAWTESLRSDVAGEPLVTVGVAPHSIRAVPREWLVPLRDCAARHDMPLHMHVSEQTGEVDACSAAFGRRPVELLHEEGLLDERFTAVHATHLNDAEVDMLGAAGVTVCACPTTERDLGDGFMRTAHLFEAGARVALGSDSQTVLDMLEEARLLEYHERLQRRRRVLLTQRVAGHEDVAPVLMRAATTAGAHALRLPCGILEPGAFADFCIVDLNHDALAGFSPATLTALLMLSAPRDVISSVWVHGRPAGYDHGQRARQRLSSVARRVYGDG